MKHQLFTLALVLASVPTFAANTVNWEIKENLVPDSETGFPQTASGRQIFADYNNDGILDFFIVAGQGTGNIALYKGNADGTYTDVTSLSMDLYAKSLSSAVFLDIDNDGNLDFITVGKDDGGNTFTDVYMNSGAPDYTFVCDYDLIDQLPGLSTEASDNGSKILVAFDYNNDGWTDLLINGNAGGVWEEIVGGNGQGRVVAIMKNVQGSFELLKNPVNGTENFAGMNGGSVDVADFDCDGWMDVIVSGYHDDLQNITKLYRNNGDGTFSEVTGVEFVGHQQGETAFIDINNDGYADVIEIGRDVKNGWASFAKLYVNDKNGSFTRVDEATTNLFGGSCALAIGDVNNDGLMDFFMSGWGTNSTFMYNNGDNTFTKQDIVPDAARCRAGAVTFVNYNNDGFLDMSIFGYRDGGGESGDGLSMWPDYILENKGGEGVSANAAPSVPANFTVTYNDSKQCYELRWDKSTDDTTPTDAIRYNVYVKMPDGKVNCVVPANLETGALKVYGTQNPFIPVNQYDVYMAKTDGVAFGVQAVDNGYMTSAFATPGGSGIADNKLESSLYKVYALNNMLCVENLSAQDASVEVITVDGRVVASFDCAARQLETRDMAAGIYLVKVAIAGKTAVAKLII